MVIVLPKAYGLTGGIASGKSTVARLFQELGVPVIEADEISHALCEPGEVGAIKIREVFGNDVLDASGRVDRSKLGKIVFSDLQQRKKLEAILHPLIMEAIQKKIRGFFDSGKDLVIVSAALLMETERDKDFHGNILVSCSQDQQLQRLMDRDGVDREEALKRIKAQWSMGKKIEKATFVIDNSQSLENTRAQVKEIYEKIRRKGGNPPLWN